MTERSKDDQSDEFAAWGEADTQDFFEYSGRADFLNWLELMRSQATEAQASLKQPDGSDLLTNKFIITSGGEETGFSFPHQRLKLTPKNRHRATPFEEVIVRLPDNVHAGSAIDCAFVSTLGTDDKRTNYYIDKQSFVRLNRQEDGNYETAEEASSTDYEDLRIILANFEVGLQDNSSGNAA